MVSLLTALVILHNEKSVSTFSIWVNYQFGFEINWIEIDDYRALLASQVNYAIEGEARR